MVYKIVRSTGGMSRGRLVEIEDGSISNIINQIKEKLDVEVDVFTIQYPYIRIINANYTIIMKEVN